MNRSFVPYLSLALLLSLWSCQSKKQDSQNTQGAVKEDVLFFGGSGTDVGNYIIKTSDGGYAIAGYYGAPNDGNYGVIIRLNAQRETLWTKTYGTAGDNRAWSLAEASDGGFVVAGFSDGPGSMGGTDVWLFKVDRLGVVQWETRLGGAQDELAWEIIKTADGNYAVAAQTESIGGGGIDAWLIKLNESGQFLWDQSYGSKGLERIFGLVEDQDGNLIATGIYKEDENADIDIYTLSVNGETGRTNWKDIVDKGGDDTGHGITLDEEGNVWITGYTSSLGNGGQDGFIAKYDGRSIASFYTMGGPANDRIMNLRAGGSDQFYFIGYSQPSTDGNRWDIWIGQTNAQGDSINSFHHGSVGGDRGVHLLIESDQIMATGMIGSKADPYNVDLAIVRQAINK